MKENNKKLEEDNKATNDTKRIVKTAKPLGKRGNSLDPSNEKRLNIQEKPQIVSLITNLQKGQTQPVKQKNYIPPKNERLFSLSPNRINIEKILPPKEPKFNSKKTLVLDLDETLVHSGFIPFNPSDIILKIEFENILHDIHVLIRPGAEEFLKKMSSLYEIIIFTASVSKYSDPLLDILDKEKLCSYRLSREHCTMINGIYVKNLKVLNRDLKDTIIVDNSPLSYAFTPENGFPVKTWYDDKTDRELYNIVPILEYLAKVHDIRKILPKIVENNEISYTKFESLINKSSRNIRDNINHLKKEDATNINSTGSNGSLVNNNSKTNKTTNSQGTRGYCVKKLVELEGDHNNTTNKEISKDIVKKDATSNEKEGKDKISEDKDVNETIKNKEEVKIDKEEAKENKEAKIKDDNNINAVQLNEKEKDKEKETENTKEIKNKPELKNKELHIDNNILTINLSNEMIGSNNTYNKNINKKTIFSDKKVIRPNSKGTANINQRTSNNTNSNVNPNNINNIASVSTSTNVAQGIKQFNIKIFKNINKSQEQSGEKKVKKNINVFRNGKFHQNNLNNLNNLNVYDIKNQSTKKSKTPFNYSSTPKNFLQRKLNLNNNVNNINININTNSSTAVKEPKDQKDKKEQNIPNTTSTNTPNHINNFEGPQGNISVKSVEKITPLRTINISTNSIKVRIPLKGGYSVNNTNSTSPNNNTNANQNINSINITNTMCNSISNINRLKGKNIFNSQSVFNTNNTASNAQNKLRNMTKSISHHNREFSLKERQKNKPQKNTFFRSPSTQAIIVSSGATKNQKALKITLNNNAATQDGGNPNDKALTNCNKPKIEFTANNITPNSKVGLNAAPNGINNANYRFTNPNRPANVHSANISNKNSIRPNSSDKINNSSVGKNRKETPKFNCKKMGVTLNKVDPENKKSVSITSRYVDRKNQILLNNPNLIKNYKENFNSLNIKIKNSKKNCNGTNKESTGTNNNSNNIIININNNLSNNLNNK